MCVGVLLGRRSCVFFSPPARRWVGYCCASCWGLPLCLFLQRLRFSVAYPAAGYPYGVTHPFWLQLPVCSCGGAMFVGFAVSLVSRRVSSLVSALSPGPAVCAAYPAAGCPWGFLPFSDTVFLTYCCAGSVSWSATLPLCYRCFSCTGWLAGVRWVLHPVSGSSHRGCDAL